MRGLNLIRLPSLPTKGRQLLTAIAQSHDTPAYGVDRELDRLALAATMKGGYASGWSPGVRACLDGCAKAR
jgi:hypothetical protein